MGTIKVNKIESNITNQQVWAVNNGTSITQVAKITTSNITFPLALNVTGLSKLNAGITASFFTAATAPTVGTHLANKLYVDTTLAALPKLVTILANDTNSYSRSVLPWLYTIPSQATMKYDMIVGNLWCNASDRGNGTTGVSLWAEFRPGADGVNNQQTFLCYSNYSGGSDGGHAYTVRMPFFFAIPKPTTQVYFYRTAGTQPDFSIQLTQLIRFPK